MLYSGPLLCNHLRIKTTLKQRLCSHVFNVTKSAFSLLSSPRNRTILGLRPVYMGPTSSSLKFWEFWCTHVDALVSILTWYFVFLGEKDGSAAEHYHHSWRRHRPERQQNHSRLCPWGKACIYLTYIKFIPNRHNQIYSGVVNRLLLNR